MYYKERMGLHGIENIWPDFDAIVSSVSNLKSNAANDGVDNRSKYNMVKNPQLTHQVSLWYVIIYDVRQCQVYL